MLEAKRLTRDFGDRRAVDEVTFEVRPSRITGFVGANGAGKTTTMRMLMGVLASSAGEVRWDGRPATAEDRRRFGYMPEERGLYPRMRLAEQLSYFARLHRVPPAQADRRAHELLEFFGLADRADDLLDSLSLGNQQRVQIAAALVHGPTALVLDEPFSGLDPLAVDAMVELLRREASELPVLFSSHQLELVERLCDDVVVMAEGRVVATGTVEELRARGPEHYRVRVASGDAAWVGDVPGTRLVGRDGQDALLALDGLEAADLAEALVARGRVLEIDRVRTSLADVFRDVAA